MMNALFNPLLLAVIFVATGGGFSEASETAPRTLSEVTVTLKSRGGAGDTLQAEVQGLASWFGTEKVDPIPLTLSSSKPTVIKLPQGRWSVDVKAPGYWSGSAQIEVTGMPRSASLDIWPAGVVEGSFTLAEGIEAPIVLPLFFRAAPEVSAADAPAPDKVLCPVKGRSWQCTLPAGLLDLRFQAAGFVPRYQWGVRVERGKSLSLGRFELARGSAVLGWVVTADGTGVGEGGGVELRPRLAGAIPQKGELQRLENLVFKAPINARGFFQIDGVPPGSYILEARQERFAPAVTTVRVAADETTEITNPPLLLDLPKTLEVFLNPALDPWGQPWRMKLQKLDRYSFVTATLATESAKVDGTWKKSNLAAGSYILSVGRASGDAWFNEPLEIEENPPPLQVNLDIVKVRGSVHLGKEPLAATLRFGGRFGALRIDTQSGEKGTFEVHLPRGGEWTVHISADEPAVQREIPRVKIEPKPDSDVTVLDLRLPDTQLRGRVVDEDGKAVARSIITVKSIGEVREASVQAFADGKGRFKLVGLLPGTALVQADGGEDRRANPIEVQIEEKRESPELVLVARRQLKITGTIVSAAGPVPGARVKVVPAGVQIIGARSVTSDSQGNFQADMPPEAREMFLSVGAPGFAFRILRIPVPEDRQVFIGVEQTAGTLIVEKPEALNFLDLNAPVVVILRGTAVEGLGYLSNWALSSGVRSEDDRQIVPSIEPGDYRACLILPSERTAVDLGLVPPGRCAAGFLAPNGELILRVPDRIPGS